MPSKTMGSIAQMDWEQEKLDSHRILSWTRAEERRAAGKLGVSWFSSQACNAILQKAIHTAELCSLVHGIWCISGVVDLLLWNCCVVEQQWEQGSPYVGTDSVTNLTGWQHMLGITWREAPEKTPGRISWHIHVGWVPLFSAGSGEGNTSDALTFCQ